MDKCVGCGILMMPGTDHLCHGCFTSKLIGQEAAVSAKRSADEGEAPAAIVNPDGATEGLLTEIPVSVEAGVTELNP